MASWNHEIRAGSNLPQSLEDAGTGQLEPPSPKQDQKSCPGRWNQDNSAWGEGRRGDALTLSHQLSKQLIQMSRVLGGCSTLDLPIPEREVSTDTAERGWLGCWLSG